jgi:hypothetical protein
MPIPHSTNTLTFGGDIKPDQIADLLQAHGIDRRLDLRTAGDRLAVTIPGRDVSALPGRINAGAEGFDVRLDPVFVSGTFLKAAGKPSPHGFEPAQHIQLDQEPQVPWERPPAGMRRPVVALLDCGVDHTHPWLPHDPAEDPFVLDAEHPAQGEPWDPGPVHLDPTDKQAGHGTFIAGIIRRNSPFAQVLSVRVMGSHGKVNETTLINALGWLVRYRQHSPVDVVVMAFGREPGDQSDQETLASLENSVAAVHREGIRIVASAGNDHDDADVFPGAWETVTAVGAGHGTKHTILSNYGPWVDEYRDGNDVVSILPPPMKWGRWSGTSFAAARYAAELAEPQHVDG